MTITSDLFKENFYNNRASIFYSITYDTIYVAYGIKSLDLECYDVIYDKKFIIKKQLHKMPFDSSRYYYDDNKKRDLLITASRDSHVKLINFKKEDSEI